MPIDYRNIGPVNEMIKNDLVEEVKMLDKMKQIKEDVSEIKVERQTLTSEELTKLSEQLSKNKKEIKSIQLPIALKDEILCDKSEVKETITKSVGAGKLIY